MLPSGNLMDLAGTRVGQATEWSIFISTIGFSRTDFREKTTHSVALNILPRLLCLTCVIWSSIEKESLIQNGEHNRHYSRIQKRSSDAALIGNVPTILSHHVAVPTNHRRQIWQTQKYTNHEALWLQHFISIDDHSDLSPNCVSLELSSTSSKNETNICLCESEPLAAIIKQ